MLETRVLDERIDYDGRQLRSHFAFETAGLVGASAVAFLGACDVPLEHVVDCVDRRSQAAIRAREMLHFLVEEFDLRLPGIVLEQRLFARLARETVAERCGERLLVRGDDLFVGERKLSVSVATVSPVSALFHFALNVDPTGAPVPAIGLAELGVSWRDVAVDLLHRFAREHQSVREAAATVRGVS